ncbi:MAG: Hint domain-containing protein [Pseudomonadota bacterium]
MLDTMTELENLGLDGAHGVTRRSGLLHATRVATRRGWRAVESLAVGDEVLTFDAGLQPITAIERVINWPDHKTCPDHAAPFEIPAGVLGNAERIWMLPAQLVVVESDLAETLTGDPFALVPVDVLDGWRGIRRVDPRAPHLVVILHFADDQVIYAGDGALVHTQAEASMVEAMMDDDPAYLPLDRATARLVADHLRAADTRGEREQEHDRGAWSHG